MWEWQDDKFKKIWKIIDKNIHLKVVHVISIEILIKKDNRTRLYWSREKCKLKQSHQEEIEK